MRGSVVTVVAYFVFCLFVVFVVVSFIVYDLIFSAVRVQYNTEFIEYI
jgi:hypothetical protein